ncbi:prolow-density lipoprotein receptor-related protein 1-like [Haliotis rubra]|uniref:prolow-density lipoprotein receptor-related protein 1-like n=1 Tax=Haliotis rubra TaxID=36100 RepID=UPI001EE614C7|nr:prolow-density lipoprotein receptor-related protein 1-like [Haliotis rubra]XP_046581528.1 prolow-density lipoprotein receptor-related protein 1-like [Haliotis rubra]
MASVRLYVVVLLLCIPSLSCFKRGYDELFALVTDFDGKIYKYSMRDKSIKRIPVSDSGQGPEAIDYDPVTSQMFWSNIRSDKIKRADLDGGNERIVRSETETPRGIAVDYINRLMFYTEEKIDIVAMLNLSSSEHKVLVRTGMDRPLAITINMKTKVIYWSDIGSPAKIETANYDGTGRKVLKSDDLRWPIALSLDETATKLFWCDGSKKKIQYLDLNTLKTTVVLYNYNSHYYDVQYVEGTLYFVDLLKRNVFQSVAATGGDVTTYSLGKTLSKWRKIRLINIRVCQDMTWGENCTHNCGNCQQDAVCNKANGYCPGKCKPGFALPTCQNECPIGFFGVDCRSICGHCHNLDTCDHLTGACLYGCAAGWDGRNCSRECPEGKHGLKCTTSCGHCKDGSACMKSSGNCTNGCEPGWDGAQCKEECLNGTFGEDCKYKCQCCDGSVCDKVTGQCPYENVTARECPVDRYGFNCSTPCGHCMDGQPCNETNGRCPTGCDVGWMGDVCKMECISGRYGADCAQMCKCFGSNVCDPISGRCYTGNIGAAKQVGDVQITDTPLTTGLCVMIVILAILLAVAIFVIYRRNRQQRFDDEPETPEKRTTMAFTNHHCEPLVTM